MESMRLFVLFLLFRDACGTSFSVWLDLDVEFSGLVTELVTELVTDPTSVNPTSQYFDPKHELRPKTN